MKKLRNTLLLAGVLAALLCVAALAENQSLAGGFYITGKASNITITPQTAAGKRFSALRPMWTARRAMRASIPAR